MGKGNFAPQAPFWGPGPLFGPVGNEKGVVSRAPGNPAFPIRFGRFLETDSRAKMGETKDFRSRNELKQGGNHNPLVEVETGSRALKMGPAQRSLRHLNGFGADGSVRKNVSQF